MICPGCDRDNDPRRRYCGRCGWNLEPACMRCSFVNAADDRFCGGCGEVMTAARGATLSTIAALAPLTVAPSSIDLPGIGPAAPTPLTSMPAAAASSPPTLRAVRPRVETAPPVTRIEDGPRRTSRAIAVVTDAHLAELLRELEPDEPPLPSQGTVTQDDLDKLFGESP